MTLSRINNINSGLMILSLGLAYLIPFELFLFSYAILGPAHYLTEISWLHDRQYFSMRKYDYLWLVGFSLLIFAGSSYVLGSQIALSFLRPQSTTIIFIAFGFASILAFTEQLRTRLVAIAVLVLASILFQAQSWMTTIFAIYLPTLIHVFVFTAAFVLYGALKSHSRSGYISFIVLIGCVLICFTYIPQTLYEVSDYARQSYYPFAVLSNQLILDFDLGSIQRLSDIYDTQAGHITLRFIAFAYTYHYLNWFSKTSLIRWHKIPKSRYAAICILWLASISLYIYDYSLGFRWLFLLSFAHVFLEFPLNHQSFLGIGKSIKKQLTDRPPLNA